MELIDCLDWRQKKIGLDSSRCSKCVDILVDKPEKIDGRYYCIDCAIGVLIRKRNNYGEI